MTLPLVLSFLTAEVVELLTVNKRISNGGRGVAFTNNPDRWLYRASSHHLGISSFSMSKELYDCFYKSDRIFETRETPGYEGRPTIYIESRSCGSESSDLCDKERFPSNFNHKGAACNAAERGHERRPTRATSTQS